MLKQKMKNLGILLVFSLMTSLSLSQQLKNCLDISDDIKEQKLHEFDKFYRKATIEIAKTNQKQYGKKYDNPYELAFKVEEYRRKGECHIRKLDFPADLFKSTSKEASCPWEYAIKTRTDKYPIDIIEAHCSCEYPNRGNEKVSLKSRVASYQCMPVLKPRPALYRQNECDAQGFYKWIPKIEMVNEACVSVKNLIKTVN